MTFTKFHPAAEIELGQAVAFYEEKQDGLGLAFNREVRRKVGQISESPKRFPFYKYGTRKCLLQRFPFNVFYLEDKDKIWIVAVAHCSRNPNYWKDRIKEI